MAIVDCLLYFKNRWDIFFLSANHEKKEREIKKHYLFFQI